ncbi:hypothetical protein [Geobacter sp. OR-1]|uniref:hypothetical protein n=1 Tax=Geobacter sp. OR-1 TaxID=1266765 RepID=UPI00126A6624|nr:hypothetical protein [Geobacter sp. OR-1]
MKKKLLLMLIGIIAVQICGCSSRRVRHTDLPPITCSNKVNITSSEEQTAYSKDFMANYIKGSIDFIIKDNANGYLDVNSGGFINIPQPDYDSELDEKSNNSHGKLNGNVRLRSSNPNFTFQTGFDMEYVSEYNLDANGNMNLTFNVIEASSLNPPPNLVISTIAPRNSPGRITPKSTDLFLLYNFNYLKLKKLIEDVCSNLKSF